MEDKTPLIVMYSLESTDPNVSVRITMQYSSLMMKKSLRCYPRLWLRLGNMVVSIASCPKMESVPNMSRAMLLVIAASQRYLRYHGQSRSRFTPFVLVNHRMKKILKNMNRLTTEQLVGECLILAESLERLLLLIASICFIPQMLQI